MIFTRNFYNVHLSHIELFDVGQPRLARYPIHWHHAHYVGAKGKYDDPSSVESLRKVSYVEIILASYELYDMSHMARYQFHLLKFKKYPRFILKIRYCSWNTRGYRQRCCWLQLSWSWFLSRRWVRN